MNDAKTQSETKIVVRRRIKAPRAEVFAAWTQPEHLKRWWRCEAGWSTPVAEVDLRVGGRYRLGMQKPDKDEPYVCYGEFREIDEPARLVFTWSWEALEFDVGVTLVTLEFLDRGDVTEVVLTHEQFPNAEVAGEHRKGWTGCLEQLAAVLEAA